VEPDQDERVGTLLRALVRRVHELGASPGSTDGLVLDLQVMGLRCLLLRAEPSSDTQVGLLSPREQEVARMVSMGHTNKTIASVLEISLYTVSTHLRRIFAKLDVSTRAAMVAVLSGNQQLLVTGQTTAVTALPVRPTSG
jgi:DNA-binding CsgD family transcriptional regulator